jgi:membrane protease YdiL (CAAX protease family)
MKADAGGAATISRSERLQIHFGANLIALLCTLGYLRVVHGADLRHLSLIPTRRDVRRGLIATVWILSPVLLINLIVSSLVKYEHTVTDLLAEQNRLSTFAFLFVSAAILTPIVEEFQFRLLLQGGLQKIADFGLTATPRSASDETAWQPTSAWPVIVTSVVFGLMHWGQGAAPIPLFFLSIGLGMVYQRTGRLFPAIVIHMLLNGATLLMEFCRLNAGLDAI